MTDTMEIKEFDQLTADIQAFVAPIKSIEVKDAQGSDLAATSLKDIKGYQKRVEEKKKELCTPLKNQIEHITNYARQITMPLVEAECSLKDQIRNYGLELERQHREAQRKAEAERQAKLEQAQKEADERAQTHALFGKSTDVDKEMQKVERETRTQVKAVQQTFASAKPKGLRTLKKVRIVDPTLLPREYLIPDETKIRKVALAGVAIPGVEIYEESTVAAV